MLSSDSLHFPKFRMQEEPTFTYCGVDFAGPQALRLVLDKGFEYVSTETLVWWFILTLFQT